VTKTFYGGSISSSVYISLNDFYVLMALFIRQRLWPTQWGHTPIFLVVPIGGTQLPGFLKFYICL